MPKLKINRSIVINAPVDKVYQTLANFKTWTSWSPWLQAEPDAKVDVSSDGLAYAWEGNITGQGEMKILNEKKNESFDVDLNFIKPWKSHADVRFELKKVDSGTQVNWLMESSLPFFMFFMQKLMNALIEMDYDRGLKMLKDYVEDGTVHSKLEFVGNNAYPGCSYVGIRTHCTADDIAEKMGVDFQKLMDYVKEDEVNGEPFSIYEKYDLVKKDVVYVAGMPVKEAPADLPEGFISGNIPDTQVYTTKHTGRYDHLGNAWSAMYQFQQKKVFKTNKKIFPFETYANNPQNTPQDELITNVHFAVK